MIVRFLKVTKFGVKALVQSVLWESEAFATSLPKIGLFAAEYEKRVVFETCTKAA